MDFTQTRNTNKNKNDSSTTLIIISVVVVAGIILLGYFLGWFSIEQETEEPLPETIQSPEPEEIQEETNLWSKLSFWFTFILGFLGLVATIFIYKDAKKRSKRI